VRRGRDRASSRALRVAVALLALFGATRALAAGGVDPALVGDHYRVDHPRLPHPDEAYLAWLRTQPKLLRDLDRTRHHGAETNLFLLYLATREPKYLAEIEALAGDEMKGRWFHRVDVLAVAYDWCYADLHPAVRARMLGRIVDITRRADDYYREIRVSPYNDVGYIRLHNAPFIGALVAYPDAPEGEPLIRFAHQVLFDVYLPVWQQVIGGGGGWHEGITYLRKGLGGVVVPTLAAWGYATGRDLFAENPWLAELIDYPIYTTRPDFTSLRMGDDNTPELTWFEGLGPLATVYDHPYGRDWLKRVGHWRDEPTSTVWPWWPPALEEPALRPVSELPPHHYFRGIGLVTMRSDWSEEATFASFRVGDHFWSHQHFDSGGFTLYHRGALAIDSGTYYAGYDSDHHYGYAMQTIAHNCITVTDPADSYVSTKASMLRWSARLLGGPSGLLGSVATKMRWLAARLDRQNLPNDGGERRVGSGGYNLSPDDLAHWQAERDDYEMGDMLVVAMEPTFVYCKGEVTAAFTNSKSGNFRADYRARTRRVRRWLRDFLYVRPDLFVVVDRVSATDPRFAKRWLLHTINRPRIVGGRAMVERAETVRHLYTWMRGLTHTTDKGRKLYQYDGRLEVVPLLPEGARLTAVGGPGHEFDIGGKNFNLDKRDHPLRVDPTQGPDEPGSWRIEIAPPRLQADDLFLTVLITGTASQPVDHRVRQVEVEAGEMVGAEVAQGGEAIALLFNRRLDDRAITSELRYRLAWSKATDVQLLFGLASGQRWRVARREGSGGVEVDLTPVGGDGEGVVMADRDGILRLAGSSVMAAKAGVERQRGEATAGGGR